MTQQNTKSFAGTVLGTALFGAIVGGTAAAAKGIRQVKSGETTKEEAAVNVAREAGTTAVAAGTAGAVVGALRLGPVLSTLGIVAVATGTKFAMDSLMEKALPAHAPAAKKHAPLIMDSEKGAAKPAPQKAAPKKTTAQKTAAKKTTAAKTASKKNTAKKAAPKKAAPKKAAAKKTTSPAKTAEKE